MGEHLGALQASRLPIAIRRAEEKTKDLQQDLAADSLIQAAQRAKTVTQRIVWLQRAATAWARPLETVATCKKGCAHCCRIPITISRKEADLIARATGRAVAAPLRPVRPADLRDDAAVAKASARLQHWKTGIACPFLDDSSYSARPLACRVLLNLDDDDLLCRHSESGPADVPYADSRLIRALALVAQPAEVLADIRDFFPSPTS